MTIHEPIQNRALTKIVATVGPACRGPKMLAALAVAGVDVFRLNMAHGNLADHEQILRSIRDTERVVGRPLGILIDLAGPKIRLGELSPDPLECRPDDSLSFVRSRSGSSQELTSDYERLIDELQVDDRVMLADGTVELIVREKSDDRATCQVVSPGILRSRQGINLPGVKLSVKAMDEQDREHARWAARNGVDFVGLSFVRSPHDIEELSSLLAENNSTALTIAKIEKPEALAQLDEIVSVAGGVMVARGDLGVEIDVAEMPVEQKRIIDTCSRWGKPVIVATQMLDSMQRVSHPTRAEVTDVANAILDGADACMLSGETAVGDFPLASVQMMNRIMLATERMLARRDRQVTTASTDDQRVDPITSAVVRGAGGIAADLGAKLVVVVTRSGATALLKAKQRDFIHSVALSQNEATLRQITLFWGISPVTGALNEVGQELLKFIDQWGDTEGCLTNGDLVVVVAGSHVHQVASNLLFVHEVGTIESR